MAKTKTELNKMTKDLLEEYGRSVGLEVDRRLKKATIVQQILEYETAPQTVESVKTRPDRVSASEKTTTSAQSSVAPSGSIDELVASMPAYNGDNAGEISSIIMRNFHLFSGHKLKFGPEGSEYHIVVEGSTINKTFKV
jgi:hypothetical protein